MRNAAVILLISGLVIFGMGVGTGLPYDGRNPETSDPALFHERSDVGIGTETSPTALTSGDLNGDGFPDLVVGDLHLLNNETFEGEARIRVLLGKGNGSFTSPGTVWTWNLGIYVWRYAFYAVAIVDLDRDDKPDIVFTGGATFYGPSLSGHVVALMGNGDGTFGEGVTLSPPDGLFALPTGVVSCDLNHDNVPDLCVSLAGFYVYSGVLVLLNNGDGTFTEQMNHIEGNCGSVAAGDLNGDNHIDLVVSASSGYAVLTMLGLGDGTFQDPMVLLVGDKPSSVAIADLDADNVPDLAVANEYSNDVSVLLGIGDGTFQEAVSYNVGETPSSIVVADLDGDSSPEIAVANGGGDDLSVLMGNGDGTFGDEGRYATLSDPQSLSGGDFNADTFPDLAVSGSDGLSVFMNKQGAPPASPWGPASTVHSGSEVASKVINMFFLLLVPVFALLLQRRRGFKQTP